MTSSQVEGLSPAAQKQFDGLRLRFVDGLVKRWCDINQAVDLPSQQALLHRLCGSAGSFGFDRLGQLARRAELNCVADSDVVLPECLSEIEAEIRVITQAVSSLKNA